MEGAAHSTLIGATIGNYRVVSKLGEGGMGSVYLAEHPLIGKKVALKVLHEEYASNQDVVTRFFNEAKAVNDIGHPNIVDIIDYGVVQTQGGPGFVYFIMEFLNGESLASVLQREAPLPPERAFAIAAQVADCLSASHAKGIIHRDLKPDNIYLIQKAREKDFVKVLDFGIAKLTGDNHGSSRTRTGIVMGTPAYMSPEQCEGRGNIDQRTDIYALGIVLYEMITGKVPFAGEGYGEVLVQHLTKRPDRPSTVRGVIPPQVEAIIMKALEKKPADRYPNMDSFMQAMRDPNGFIQANGGMGAFFAMPPDGSGMATQMMQSNPGVQQPYGSQPGLQQYASQPGLQQYASQPGLQHYASQPGLMPRPVSTLQTGVGQVEGMPQPKSKLPLLAGIGGVLLIGGVVGIVLATSGKKSSSSAQAAGAPTSSAAVSDAPPPQPPPPPPQQPAAVTTAEPQTVTIKLTSVPPGAMIYVADESAPRGKTPYDLTMPKADTETLLHFKMDGFVTKDKTVKASRDGEFEIALEKEAPKPDVVHNTNPNPNPNPVIHHPPPPPPPPQNTTSSKAKKPDDDDVLAPNF
jgi:serine/threonine-protein kinase